jgi:hypothetical protein
VSCVRGDQDGRRTAFEQRDLAALLVGEWENVFEARVAIAQLVASPLLRLDALPARGLLSAVRECLREDVPRHPAAATCVVLPVVGESIIVVCRAVAPAGAWRRPRGVVAVVSGAVHEPAGTDPGRRGPGAAAALARERVTVSMRLSMSVRTKVGLAVCGGVRPRHGRRDGVFERGGVNGGRGRWKLHGRRDACGRAWSGGIDGGLLWVARVRHDAEVAHVEHLCWGYVSK